MVLLAYKIQVKASLDKVWEYFSKFQHIGQWDPNVRSSKIGKLEPQLLGTTYDLVTVFKGDQSDIVYTLIQHVPMRRICVKGKNGMITAIDEISFKEITKGEVTQIYYEANITLNHILCCFTCLIRKDLQHLARLTEQGMKEKCRQLFGKNSV